MTIEQLEALEEAFGPQSQRRHRHLSGNRRNQIQYITVLRAVDLLGHLPR